MSGVPNLRARIALYAGTVSTLTGGTASAINKSPIPLRCYISSLGINGDEYADRRNHGGADRALLFYSREHYGSLKSHFSSLAPLSFGCLGENLSGVGLTEANVCIGDIFTLGNALIEVSQPRSPCFKLGIRCGDREVPRLVQEFGWTGYFFRVLHPGECDGVAEMVLRERPEPDLTVASVGQIYFSKDAPKQDLEKLADSPALCQRWKNKIQKRIVNGAPECSLARLYGASNPRQLHRLDAACSDTQALSKYIPIDCDLHDYLEIAGVKGYPLRIACIGGADFSVQVQDLVTKSDKSEWLVCADLGSGMQREIRLDYIRDITAIIENADFSFVKFR